MNYTCAHCKQRSDGECFTRTSIYNSSGKIVAELKQSHFEITRKGYDLISTEALKLQLDNFVNSLTYESQTD